jgi:hypothetical protein
VECGTGRKAGTGSNFAPFAKFVPVPGLPLCYLISGLLTVAGSGPQFSLSVML